MERLMEANSDFEPVHIEKLDSSELETNPYRKQAEHESIVQSIMPVGLQSKGVQEQREQRKRKRRRKFQRCCRCTSQSIPQNYANFKRSAAPSRLMYRQNGSWLDFSNEVREFAKSAFLERNPTVEIKVDGNNYLLDFYRMLQIDLLNGVQRSIAWIDSNGSCHFPKFVVDDGAHTCSEIPKIEIEIKLANNSSSGKRKREDIVESEEEDTANSPSSSEIHKLKRRCSLNDANLEKSRWPNSRLIKEGEKAFSDVRDLFMAGMKTIDPGVKITSIYQFTPGGPVEKARWEVFHKQMEIIKNARGFLNTVCAWHGASKKDVLNILAHGFGLPSKLSGSQTYGMGVYLSPACLPHISHPLSEIDENGQQHIVLCRVILGNIEKVADGSQQSHPSSVFYDSGVDNIGNPKWFVVWSTNMNTSILPEYVISYTCSDHLQDGMKWIPNSSSSGLKLFSKVGNMLPSAKVEKFKSLCRSYKAGKMAKDSFIKQLRSVAGDEILLSAIWDVQGLK